MATTPNIQDPLDALAAMGNQQAAPQPAASSDDPLDALANMKPAQQPQPGFFDRAAQTSGISSLWGTMMTALHNVTSQPQTDFQDTLAARDAAAAQLKQGDLVGAAKTIVGHLAKHVAQTSIPGAVPFLETAAGAGSSMAASSAQHARAAVTAPDATSKAVNAAEAVPVAGQVVESVAKPFTQDYRSGNYVGLAGDVAGAVVQALVARGLLKGGAAEEAADEGAAEPGIVSRVKSAATNIAADIPKETEGKLVGALGDIAEKNGLDRPEATTAREAVADLAGQYKDRAQQVYQQLDDEAPGFQELKDSISKQQQALRVQENLDPEKAGEIEANLNQMRSTMDDLLSDEQKQRWAAADADYSRFRAIQQFQRKVTAAGEDLTSPELTSVDKLQSGMRTLANATRKGNPVDVLNRAFGPDADTLKSIVQEGTENLSKQDAGRALLKWLGAKVGGAAILGGVGYGTYHALKGGE